jgi:hypothetical protein
LLALVPSNIREASWRGPLSNAPFCGVVDDVSERECVCVWMHSMHCVCGGNVQHFVGESSVVVPVIVSLPQTWVAPQTTQKSGIFN